MRNRISIEKAESVEIKNGNLEESLNELIDRINPSWKFVTVNLDPESYFQKIVHVPYFEDDSLMQEWLVKQKQQLIPEEFEESELKIVHHLLGDPEEGLTCQFTVAVKEVIQERVHLLESTGLQVVSVRAGSLEAGYALMFNEGFNTGTTSLLSIFEDGASLLRYQRGLLYQVYEFPNDLSTAGEIQSEAQSMLLSMNGAQKKPAEKVWQVRGKTVENDKLDDKDAEFSEVFEAQPLAQLENAEEVLDQDDSIACGMAVAQLYPSLDTLNLLDGAEMEASNKAIEKKDALVSASVLGGITAFLLASMLLIQVIVGGWLDEADVRVNELEDKIAAVSDARAKVATLKKNVETAREMVVDKSSFAKLLHQAGSAVPGNVWLTGLHLQDDSSLESRLTLRFKGYAKGDAKLTELLKELEQKSGIYTVRLVESRQVLSEEIYEEPALRNTELTYFDIEMTANGNEGVVP